MNMFERIVIFAVGLSVFVSANAFQWISSMISYNAPIHGPARYGFWVFTYEFGIVLFGIGAMVLGVASIGIVLYALFGEWGSYKEYPDVDMAGE